MARRKTQSTIEILSALKSAESAMSHQMIEDSLDIEVDRATIYRVLNRFYEDGMVHRVIGENGKQYFALCENCDKSDHNHDHFHFRCKKCGKVECLSKEIEIKLPMGYISENFNGMIAGTCASCT
jgi:Fur family ferric uptake transcriptional regulator